MRTQENFTISALPSVVANASDGLRERLGLTAWHGIHGRVGALSPRTATEHGLPFMSTREEVDRNSAAAFQLEPAHGPQDMDALRTQLDTVGYCVLPKALGLPLQAALSARLQDQAAAELQAGVESRGADGTQRVLTLLNKGAAFEPLLRPSSARQLVEHVIGAEYLLSHATGCVHRASSGSSSPPPLHDTQWWMPQPIRRGDMVPRIRPGNASPASASAEAWQGQSSDWIAPAASARLLWMLEAQSVRVVSGSHRSGRHPTPEATSEAVAVSADAGSCVVLDGRLWFAPGFGAHLDTSWCGPQFRPEENHPLGMSPEVLEGMEENSRALLGYKVWHSYGQLPGAPYDGMFDASVDLRIGVMRLEADI
jgi:hypothetical protein